MEKYPKRIFFNDGNAPYSDFVELLHESFKERLEANMNFGCATFTEEDLRKATIDSYIISFFDGVKPIAMGVLQVKKKMGITYGVYEYLAVLPQEKYRRKGLGGMVHREIMCKAKYLGIGTVVSSTAVGAISSVNYHLKTGCKIYRLKHYNGKNYLSYVFFYPVKKSLLNVILIIFRKPILWISKQFVK